MKIDIHIHSNIGSDGLSGPEEIIRMAKFNKLDGICITEHDSVGDYNVWKKFNVKDLLILMGVEISAKNGHVLIFSIQDNIDINLYKGKSASEISLLIEKEDDMAIIVAHPYYDRNGIKKDIFNGRFHALEINHDKDYANVSEQAIRTAKELGLGLAGGSDAHMSSHVGKAYTIFENEIKNIEDFIREIRYGNYRPAFQDHERNEWLNSLL